MLEDAGGPPVRYVFCREGRRPASARCADYDKAGVKVTWHRKRRRKTIGSIRVLTALIARLRNAGAEILEDREGTLCFDCFVFCLALYQVID